MPFWVERALRINCVATRSLEAAFRSNEQTKTLVSRKNLSLIHFVPAEVSPGIHVPHVIHQRIEALCVPRALRELRKPFPECRVQSSALRSRDRARPLDQVLVGAQGNIFHTKLVYTFFVRFSVVGFFKLSDAGQPASMLARKRPPRNGVAYHGQDEARLSW